MNTTRTPHRNRTAPRAFTLVELMVVITIIVLLLSLLAPSMDTAVERAEWARCAANLRGITLTCTQYAVESRGALPPGAMTNNVPDYGNPAVYAASPTFFSVAIDRNGGGRGMFLCPATRLLMPGADAPTPWSDTSYMGNGALFGRRLSRIDRPSGVIAVQELLWRSRNGWYRPVAGASRTYGAWHFNTFGTFPGKETYNAGHHFGEPDYAGNTPFVDGHVEHRLGVTLRAEEFGLTSGPGLSGRPTDTHADPDNLSYRSRFD